MSRRALIGGAVPVTAAAIGAVAAMATQLSPVVESPSVTAPATPATASPIPTVATPPATPVATAARPTAVAPRVATPELTTIGLPEGMALVASPRLPLAGVGPEDPWRLLNGRVASWGEVGAPLPWPVRPLALRDERTGVSAEQTFATFDDLAAALTTEIGGVALVPLDLVDFRVQTLLVGGEDPLRSAGGESAPVRIGVVGDIVPGRNVHLHMQQYGDFTRPFRRIAPLLSSFDVMVANLEGNLSATLPQPADPHSVTFVSDPAMLEGFALAGIDAVTLANNHTVWNSEGWGVQGLLDTIAALDDYGVPYFGAGTNSEIARAPWIVAANGISIAFLGIDAVTANYEVEPGVATGVLDFDAGAGADYAGTNPYLAAQVAADVAAAVQIADVVIPYFHLGAEYVAVAPPWAVEATHLALDAGAAMVVTNHPHLIQGMEVYANKPVVYSPGNFILDQMWAAEVRSGYVLEIVLRGTTIAGLRFHGVEIEDFHQPRQMSGGEQAALMDRFWAATDRLAARANGAP
jgi:poly-gamma-glutamate synthesis protein (capsule biosynthesis protein)